MSQEIASLYIKYLESGNMDRVLSLFATDAVVRSPIYGTKSAVDFYTLLSADTSNSKLEIKGIFDEKATGNIALYFNYGWTMRNGKVVNFDVVDIIIFDEDNKISELTILYDTVHSRVAIKE